MPAGAPALLIRLGRCITRAPAAAWRPTLLSPAALMASSLPTLLAGGPRPALSAAAAPRLLPACRRGARSSFAGGAFPPLRSAPARSVGPPARSFAASASNVGAGGASKTLAELEALRVNDLKEELRRLDLPVSGVKAQLIGRLLVAYRSLSLAEAASSSGSGSDAPSVAEASSAADADVAEAAGPPGDGFVGAPAGGTPRGVERRKQMREKRPSGMRMEEFVASRPGQAIAPRAPAAAAPEPAVPEFCPGCGIRLQERDMHAPGFYKRPEPKMDKEGQFLSDEEALAGGAVLPPKDRSKAAGAGGPAAAAGAAPATDKDAEYAATLQKFEDALFNDPDEPPLPVKAKKRVTMGPSSDRRDEPAAPLVVCARCHSLRHYGRVKEADAEAMMPAFDFAAAVSKRMQGEYAFRATVLILADLADFDGSFPRSAAMLLSMSAEEAAEQEARAARAGRGADEAPTGTGAAFKPRPRLVLAATKADLIPAVAQSSRLVGWVRRRAKAGGLHGLAGTHLVSALTGEGIPELAARLEELCGARGDVWVVGAQNAGKSSLINALRKHYGADRARDLTEASMPGTTVGILRLDDILPGRRRVFDTPGILHPHQLSTRVPPADLRLLQARRPLAPRTFLMREGSTLFLGGGARIDMVGGDRTMLTVWAAPDVVTHFGKTETAPGLYAQHAGALLRPPTGEAGVADLGPLVPRDVEVTGRDLQASSTDVVVAGLGWVGVAVAGSATLRVHAPAAVQVTMRDALMPDQATQWSRPGFGPEAYRLQAKTTVSVTRGGKRRPPR